MFRYNCLDILITYVRFHHVAKCTNNLLILFYYYLPVFSGVKQILIAERVEMKLVTPCFLFAEKPATIVIEIVDRDKFNFCTRKTFSTITMRENESGNRENFRQSTCGFGPFLLFHFSSPSRFFLLPFCLLTEINEFKNAVSCKYHIRV